MGETQAKKASWEALVIVIEGEGEGVERRKGKGKGKYRRYFEKRASMIYLIIANWR